MFGKLKDKLKSALSIFSKKAEEVAEEKKVEEVIEDKAFEKEVFEEIIAKEVKEIKEVITKKTKPKTIEPEKKKKEFSEKVEVKKEKEEIKTKVITETTKERISPNQVKITYFVHGTTTDNEKGLCTGWAQGELSPLGKTQAKELKDKIKEKDFAAIFSSDLKRAVDSVRLGFNEFNIPKIQDKRLRECNYGDFNQEKEGGVDYLERINISFPGGESLTEVEKRIRRFLNELFEKYRGKHVAILAHKAPQLALEVLLNGKSWEEAIKTDWRLKKAWQPGWIYVLNSKLIESVKKETIPEKQIIREKVEPIKPNLKEEVLEEQPKKSFFGKLKEFVTTKTISAEKFEELFWDLELALSENNVSVEVIEKIKENLKTELVDKPLPRDVSAKIEETLKETLTEILTFERVNLLDKIKKKKPYIIAFFGINGSGKTTSIAKLAYYLQQKGFSVVLAAADTFRAAAIDQLEEHANKLKVKMIKHAYGSDAAAVAFDAVKYAEKNKIDVVLIDTAGRLHSNTNLMAELEKIIRINKPDLKVFIGEAITGNDCIEQARKFNELVELDGSILTKADVDEKGGAPLSIAYTIKKPILFLGTGQKYSDFEEFDAETILGKLGF